MSKLLISSTPSPTFAMPILGSHIKNYPILCDCGKTNVSPRLLKDFSFRPRISIVNLVAEMWTVVVHKEPVTNRAGKLIGMDITQKSKLAYVGTCCQCGEEHIGVQPYGGHETSFSPKDSP